jgi:proteasome lid subunit RPN8/RPN11
MLVMATQVLKDLRERCEAAYPHETCGLLLGREEGLRRVVARVFPGRNLEAQRLRDRYVLDPRDFIAADVEASRVGEDILGVYHSHPDHPSQPSATDLERAQPVWSYVIVSVAGGPGGARATSERSWVLTECASGPAFAEEPICAC